MLFFEHVGGAEKVYERAYIPSWCRGCLMDEDL